MADMVEKMAYFGAVPWHGFGETLEESDWYDLDSTSVKSGLDWEAELAQLMTIDDHQHVDRFAVRRKTDKRILGDVGPRYHILQNQKAFEWFKPFLDSKEAALHTAGSLYEGSVVWILAKLNRSGIEVAEGDKVEKFILLSNSHDGKKAVRVGFTPIRVVCANTMAMAHSNKASKLIRVRHSASVEENLVNIREVMDVANQEFEANAKQYRLLATKGINQSDLEKYVKRVLDLDEVDKISSRSQNIISKIMEMAKNGRGNDLPSVRNTYWTAYNGVSEYLTWERGGKNKHNRLHNLWFGQAKDMNVHALETALDMCA